MKALKFDFAVLEAFVPSLRRTAAFAPVFALGLSVACTPASVVAPADRTAYAEAREAIRKRDVEKVAAARVAQADAEAARAEKSYDPTTAHEAYEAARAALAQANAEVDYADAVAGQEVACAPTARFDAILHDAKQADDAARAEARKADEDVARSAVVPTGKKDPARDTLREEAVPTLRGEAARFCGVAAALGRPPVAEPPTKGKGAASDLARAESMRNACIASFTANMPVARASERWATLPEPFQRLAFRDRRGVVLRGKVGVLQTVPREWFTGQIVVVSGKSGAASARQLTLTDDARGKLAAHAFVDDPALADEVEVVVVARDE